MKKQIITNLILAFGYLSFGQTGGGYYYSTFLCADSTVWTVGGNFNDQLGDGTGTDSKSPVLVPGLNNVVAIASGGDHNLALKSDGTVWSWGYNKYGQLGNSTFVNSNTPVQVQGLDGIVQIAGGEEYSLAVRADGSLWVWGKNNLGQLGIGSTQHEPAPVQVTGLTGVVAVAAGQSHTMAITNDGTLWSWGSNGYGQLGNNSTVSSLVPAQVAGITDVKEIACGNYHSVALLQNGNVYSWGYNGYGTIGDGTTTLRLLPAPATGINNVIKIAAGQYNTIALKDDGSVWSWGINNYGQLGDGTSASSNLPVQSLTTGTVVDVAAGQYHTLATENNGDVWSWGFNNVAQLGDSSNANKYTPVKVKLECQVTQIEPVCLGSAGFSASSIAVCQNQDISFTNTSSGNYQNKWFINGTAQAGTVDLQQTFTAPGTYQVELIVNPQGCADTATIQVTIDEMTDATIDPVDDICDNDGIVALSVATEGGTWSGPGVSGNTFDPVISGSGTHQVFYEVVNGSCTSSDSMEIMVLSPPVAGFASDQAGDSVVFISSSANAASWQWYFGDGTSSTDESPVHHYGEPGTYYVLLIASNSCGANAVQQSVTINTTGIKQQSGLRVNIYPVPTSGRVTIETMNLQADGYLIFDMNGQEVREGKTGNDKQEINLAGLASGNYIIKLDAAQQLNYPLIIK